MSSFRNRTLNETVNKDIMNNDAMKSFIIFIAIFVQIVIPKRKKILILQRIFEY